MLNEHDKKMIDKAFEGHTLIKNSESKSWLVKNPGKHEYWFRVTWSPGNLSLSGDVGELVLTHYQAMPTWQDAVEWVAGACHGYLMQKSNANTKFDEEDTIKQLLLMADEHLNEYDDDCFWVKLSNLTGIDIEEKDRIRKEIECGFFESPQDVYEFMDDADWVGSFRYEIGTYYQYEALQVWARAISKGLTK